MDKKHIRLANKKSIDHATAPARPKKRANRALTGKKTNLRQHVGAFIGADVDGGILNDRSK